MTSVGSAFIGFPSCSREKALTHSISSEICNQNQPDSVGPLLLSVALRTNCQLFSSRRERVLSGLRRCFDAWVCWQDLLREYDTEGSLHLISISKSLDSPDFINGGRGFSSPELMRDPLRAFFGRFFI